MALGRDPNLLPYLSKDGLEAFNQIRENITDEEWDVLTWFYGNRDLTDDALDAARDYLRSVDLLFGERLKKKKKSRASEDEALPARPLKRLRLPKLMMDSEEFTGRRSPDVPVSQTKGDFRDRLSDRTLYLADVAARVAAEKINLPEENEVPPGYWGDCFRLVLQFFKLNGSGPHRGKIYFAEFDVGTWLCKQNISKLTPRQRSLLYRLPGYASTQEESWEIHFKLLAEFAEKYDCLPTDISPFLVYKGVRIAHWEAAMREKRSKMCGSDDAWLAATRCARLETIRGWHW